MEFDPAIHAHLIDTTLVRMIEQGRRIPVLMMPREVEMGPVELGWQGVAYGETVTWLNPAVTHVPS